MGTMGAPQACENCKLHKRDREATHVYRSKFTDELTYACRSCYDEAQRQQRLVLSEPRGPYAGQLGSKGSDPHVSFGKGKAAEMRRAAYDYVLEHGPEGADEMARKLGYNWHSFRPRCSELTTAEYGHVFRQGKGYAPTARHGKQRVYEINPEASL